MLFCADLSCVGLWMKSGFIFKDSLSPFIPAIVLVFISNFTLGITYSCISVLLQTYSCQGHSTCSLLSYQELYSIVQLDLNFLVVDRNFSGCYQQQSK